MPRLSAFAIAFAALLYGTSSMPAYAYLDPGTGSMILQVLLGGVAGLALAGRFYWNKFRDFLGLAPATVETNDPERTRPAQSKQADQ